MSTKEQVAGTVSQEVLAAMAARLRVLAHPQRLRIVECLGRLSEAPVHRIMADVCQPQATTSQHLNLMKRFGLIASERRGKEIWYRVADPKCLVILDCIKAKGSRT